MTSVIKNDMVGIGALLMVLVKGEDMIHLHSLKTVIKQVCFVLNLTYKELADNLGLQEGTIKNIARTNILTKPFAKALLLYLENIILKNERKQVRVFKESLKEFLK